MPVVSLGIVFATPLLLMIVHAVGTRAKLQFESRIKTTAYYCVSLSVFLSALVLYINYKNESFNFSTTTLTVLVIAQLAHIYFHFFNMSETARRINILVKLRRREFQSINDLVSENYSTENMLEVRLERLKQLGSLDRLEGKYRAKFNTLTLAAILIKSYERLIFPKRFQT